MNSVTKILRSITVTRAFGVCFGIGLLVVVAWRFMPDWSADDPESDSPPIVAQAEIPGAKLSGLRSKNLIAAEKRAFFEKHNIAPEIRFPVSARDPVARFWIDRLYHPDPDKREQAFKIIEAAGTNIPSPHSVHRPNGLNPDEQLFRSIFTYNEREGHAATIGLPDLYLPPNFPRPGFSFLRNQGDLVKLVAAFASRLDQPENAATAFEVLNAATMNVYDEESAEWWQDSFPSSQLACLVQNIPWEGEQ